MFKTDLSISPLQIPHSFLHLSRQPMSTLTALFLLHPTSNMLQIPLDLPSEYIPNPTTHHFYSYHPGPSHHHLTIFPLDSLLYSLPLFLYKYSLFSTQQPSDTNKNVSGHVAPLSAQSTTVALLSFKGKTK